MKDKINRYARGVFEYESPKLDISEYFVEKELDINSTFTGELHLNGKNGKPVKGVIYSTNSLVKLIKNNFYGEENVLTYVVDASMIDETTDIEGKFEIVSDAGEYEVSYLFKVADHIMSMAVGEIRNLFHFTNLVQNNPLEAQKIFYSDSFKRVFLKDDIELLNIYEGLLQDNNKQNVIEEFLVAIHKKTRVMANLSKTEAVFDRVYETIRDSLVITKSIWGYVEYRISTDVEFIRFEESYVDGDKFAGNRYTLNYYIDYDKLHAGKNFGKIIVENAYQRIECAVTVTKADYMPKVKAEYKRYYVELLKAYIDFRTGKINFEKWIQLSDACINVLRKIDENDMYIKLFKAHLCLAVKKEEKAKELIDAVKEQVYEDRYNNIELYSLLLYENSLYNKDAVYASQVCQTIKGFYEKDFDRWPLLWVLCYLDQENERNKSLKLIRIKEQFNKGCTSPLMYIEALNAFNETPTLFRVFNEFEIQVINFGCKYGAINEKFALSIAQLAAYSNVFVNQLFRILVSLYEQYNNNDILSAIVTLLIRNDRLGKKYYPWYAKGVEQDLKITNLFENYIYSRSLTDMSPLPKLVLMYFKYNNNLDYCRMAYLMANVILNRNKNLADYQAYRPQIEKFALEQIEKQRINDDLAIIYNTLIDENVVNIMGENAFNIFFTYKFQCSDERIRCVVIRHKELNYEKKIPFVNGVAYSQIYTDNPLIMLESYDGSRYINTIPYVATGLIDREKFLNTKVLQGSNVNQDIYLYEYYKNYMSNSSELIQCCVRLMGSNIIKDSYKDVIIENVINYYHSNYECDDIKILDNINADALSQANRIKLLETYITLGRYEKAIELIYKVECDKVEPKRLLKLCTYMIHNGSKEENVLISMAINAYRKEKYNEESLRLLANGYNGSTKEMASIYKQCILFGIDAYLLSERVTVQALFTGTYFSKMMEVFKYYHNQGAKERVIEAFIAYYAYNYFVKEKNVDDFVFEIMESMVNSRKDVILVVKLAVLKYYSELRELSEERLVLAQALLDELAKENIVFEFYRKFSGRLKLAYNIIDKTVIEYRTNPKNKVVIHYLLEKGQDKANYIVEEMHHIIEGVFVKQFVLFYGEEVKYYITEEDEEEELTESANIVNSTIEYSQGRFDKINDMLIGLHMDDSKSMRKMVSNYEVLSYISDKLFVPIE